MECIPTLTQLRTLTFDIMLWNPSISRNSPQILRGKLHYLIALLVSLPDTSRATLQEVRLSWSRFERSRPTHAFLREDWEAFSAALESFQELRRVDFIWEHSYSSESTDESQMICIDPERFIVDTLTQNDSPIISPTQFLRRLQSRGLVHYSVVNV